MSLAAEELDSQRFCYWLKAPPLAHGRGRRQGRSIDAPLYLALTAHILVKARWENKVKARQWIINCWSWGNLDNSRRKYIGAWEKKSTRQVHLENTHQRLSLDYAAVPGLHLEQKVISSSWFRGNLFLEHINWASFQKHLSLGNYCILWAVCVHLGMENQKCRRLWHNHTEENVNLVTGERVKMFWELAGILTPSKWKRYLIQ